MNVAKYFIMAIFSGNLSIIGEEHFVEEWMPTDLADKLEKFAQKEHDAVAVLDDLGEWDLDELTITAYGMAGEQDSDATFIFYINREGEIYSIDTKVEY